MGLLSLVGVGGWAAVNYASSFREADNDTPTSFAKKMTLTDIVVEQGSIESQQNIKGNCKVEGYECKIIFILPEGTKVKKGDVVVRFDDAQALKDITEWEMEVQEAESNVQEAEQNVKVQKNENDSLIRQANQDLKFAELDLKKYTEGDFEVNKSDLEGSISESQTEVDKAKRGYENMRALVKKGFRQFEQLREAEQVVKSAELRLQRDKKKYEMLINYEDVKSRAEFKSKKIEAEFKLDAAKDTAKAKLNQANDSLQYRKRRLKSRQKRLDRYRKNLERFEIKAPDDGTVAYPTESRYWGGEDIREGATVWQNQTVFNLPNMSKMQVKVGIHESLISKIKPGLPASIKIDAFAGQTLKGVITKVAPLAESSRFSASKTYSTIVKIESIPEEVLLKPGMNAQVEILAGRFPNVICVPVQSVVSNAGKKFVYVKKGRSFERREVEADKANVSFVEIVGGLDVGEEVALDAFQRGIEDFGDMQPEELLANDESNELFDPASVQSPEPESAVGKTSEEVDPDAPPRPKKLSEAESETSGDDAPPKPTKKSEVDQQGSEEPTTTDSVEVSEPVSLPIDGPQG